MSWRESITRLREAEDAACNRANHANPWPVVGSDSHDSHDCTKQADDSEDADLQRAAADVLRVARVEGLTVDDLDTDTALNLTWFARLGTAARPGIRIWCRALAAAKRHPSGLGVVSAPVGGKVLIGVARRGQWSRLLEVERENFCPFAMIELLQQLAPDCALA